MLNKVYKTTYDFVKFKMIRSFGDSLKNNIVTMDTANDEQNQLVKKIKEFIGNTRPTKLNMKKEKESVMLVKWHFSKEEKWSIIFLKVECFHHLHMMKLNIFMNFT